MDICLLLLLVLRLKFPCQRSGVVVAAGLAILNALLLLRLWYHFLVSGVRY